MSKINNKSLLAIAITTALSMAGTAVASNGYFAHSFSQKDAGLAGAGVAKVKNIDALSGAINPANMVWAGDRWDLGINVSFSDHAYNSIGGPAIPEGTEFIGGSPLGRIESCAQPTNQICELPLSIGPQGLSSDQQEFLPNFGWNKMISDDSSIGVMVYSNGHINTEFTGGTARVFNHLVNLPNGEIETAAGTYGGGVAGIELNQWFIAPTFAMKFGENTSVGISAIAAFQNFEARGLSRLANFSLSPNNFSNNGSASSNGIGVKIGINSEVKEGLRLAASYQSKIGMGNLDEYSGLLANAGEFDIPATWTLGLAAEVGEKGTFVLDIQRIDYADIDSLANESDPGFDLLQGFCEDSYNEALFRGDKLHNLASGVASGTTCFGGTHGIGFGWENMSVIKLGYEYEHNADWTFRAGFSMTDHTIGRDEVFLNILTSAVVENHFTAGFTKQLSQGSEMTMSFMYGAGSKVSGSNPLDTTQILSIDMDQYQVGFTYSRK